ncbi:MAG TPA: PAS domain S-box protein [Pirellulales bacterium]|jgi:PAS domain S-box-containing protein
MFDFFEFSNEMLCVADGQGYFSRVNQTWIAALGWSETELTMRPYIEFVHPDDIPATLREAALLQTGMHETISFENRYRCRDGSYRWLSWRVKMVPGTNQLAGSARDVTEEKAQAEALRAAEERFRQYMDHSPTLAWAKDEQGRMVYLNKAAEDGMRMRVADWRGKTDFDLWPAHIAQQFRKNDLKVWSSGNPLTVIESTPNTDGGITHWMSIKFPYQDRDGQKFIGGIGINVTELKNAEAAVQKEQDLLRNLLEVQEREKQLLCQEFHDGLIQYAVGAKMLLESQVLKGPAGMAIEAAITNLQKGIEDGRRTIRGIRPAVLDDSGLEAAIDDLIDQFSKTGIHITCQCDPGLGKLPMSLHLTIYRVIQEALSNAAKHSETDVIRIELRKMDDDVLLEVSDFGCGFDIKSVGKSSFGLRGMVERVRLLGGECSIESSHDTGTQVHVRLPLARV